MRVQYTLTKEDIITVLANHFNVPEKDVRISQTAVWKGRKSDEHYEYEPKAVIYINKPVN